MLERNTVKIVRSVLRRERDCEVSDLFDHIDVIIIVSKERMTIYMKNKTYSKEYIADILNQISAPINKKVSEIAKETGISTNTNHN